MTNRQKAGLEMLVRVLMFLWRNKRALGAVVWSRGYGMLRQATRNVSGHAMDQGAARELGHHLTEVKAKLRDDLRIRHMQPVAAIAFGVLFDKPVLARLNLPRKRVADAIAPRRRAGDGGCGVEVQDGLFRAAPRGLHHASQAGGERNPAGVAGAQSGPRGARDGDTGHRGRVETDDE